MEQGTILWYDYETTGIDPKRDRVMQFAAVRTDLDLTVVGEPINWFVRLGDDVLPNPQAIMVTGITPDHCQKNGMSEAEFFSKVFREMSKANTCCAGYNSIRFDDEFTRYGLYRNFFDPYVREWQKGNSRWDILDMVRATHDLRPVGIKWPQYEGGRTSFKLEDLAKENQLGHEQAHDALSDVYATIGLARLIKQHQPRLYDFFFKLRRKAEVLQHINLKQPQPIVHTSRMFCRDEGCSTLMLPLVMHPKNKNSLIAYDLRIDPQQLLQLSADEIRERLYTKWEDLAEDETPMALKQIHINKSPMIAPVSIMDEAAAKRLDIDMELVQQRIDILTQEKDLIKKILTVYAENTFDNSEQDAEHALYGGFFSEADRQRITQVNKSTAEQLQQRQWNFDDERLDILLFRYRARNYPDTLNDLEKLRWQLFRKERLVQGRDGVLNFEVFFNVIDELRIEHEQDKEKLALLNQLERYAVDLKASI